MQNENDEITRADYISKDLDTNIAVIKNAYGSCSDLVVNYFRFNSINGLACANIYISSLVDRNILHSLSSELNSLRYELNDIDSDIDFDTLMGRISGLGESKKGVDYSALYADLLSGDTVFLADGYSSFFSVSTKTAEGRSIGEPTSQTTVRGPKDSFNEKINSNILLIRKRIKSKDLKVESLSIGNVTKTAVSIMYIDKIAKEEIVQEIRNRLGKIEIDGILEGSYIVELIKDDRYSIFPTFLNSEKPDSVAAALLEGKVAILIDGTPYVLTAPALMFEFLQVSEDYYHHFIMSSVLRFSRHIALLLTLLVPSIYIAITTFHQEMLPTILLVNIAAQREGVPFPALIEALLMEFTFEILREGGIRMPRATGSAISIVGALVLGQAAVQAGIISAVMVIVVSITAIASFAIPNYEMSNAIRLVRFVLMLLAGVLGLYGVFMGLIVLVFHLCKVKSITVPYLTPVAPKIKGGYKDTLFRFPLWDMRYRPAGISGTDKPRIAEDTPVAPNQKEEPEFR